MKNFDIQVDLITHRHQASVSLIEVKQGGEIIVKIVDEKDAYQTGCELLAQALGVSKPDRNRMLFDGVIGETEANLLRDLDRYSGA